MSRYSRYSALCLAALAPALASGTSSPHLALACTLTLLVSSFSAVAAVRCTNRSDCLMLPRFAALLTASAIAFGCELIISAAFPSTFEGAPTFPITGASVFFAVCLAPSLSSEPLSHALSCTALSSALVLFCGMLRCLFVQMPLSGHISAGLIFAGLAAALILLFMPERKEKTWET